MKVKVSTGHKVIVKVKAEIGNVSVPVYSGEYEVIPRTSTDVVLKTSGMKMKENITVKPVPFFEVENPQGGKSIFIPDGDLMEA